ncbi:MAG: hypothetical protein HFG80_11910 [Eubacterium sp.]|nr:hypothetical protein [Eubacterium sp.]
MGVEFRQKGLVTMIPHASSPVKKFGELSFEEIKALTPDLTLEEAASPFAKYFYEENKLPQEFEAIANGPAMNVEDAFEPWDYAKHMNTDGYCRVENGYCVLKSGIAYSAVMIQQPGRTNEKMDAYNKEFAPEGALAYKTWTPGAHYFHFTDGAIEDFGYGLLHMHAIFDEDSYCNGTDVTKLGVELERVKENDPRCIWIGGNYWEHFQVLDTRISDQMIAMLIVNYLRETKEGRELRIRIFAGVGIKDGEFIRTPLPKGYSAEEIARYHMIHLMLEYGHEARLVNQFWEERQKSRN